MRTEQQRRRQKEREKARQKKRWEEFGKCRVLIPIRIAGTGWDEVQCANLATKVARTWAGERRVCGRHSKDDPMTLRLAGDSPVLRRNHRDVPPGKVFAIGDMEVPAFDAAESLESLPTTVTLPKNSDGVRFRVNLPSVIPSALLLHEFGGVKLTELADCIFRAETQRTLVEAQEARTRFGRHSRVSDAILALYANRTYHSEEMLRIGGSGWQVQMVLEPEPAECRLVFRNRAHLLAFLSALDDAQGRGKLGGSHDQ